MKQSKIIIISLMLAISTMVIPLSLHAEALINQSSNIFKFQQKLADNGNVVAQYRLASMYETGEGVTASIEQANYWYGKAADAGSRQAMHRHTYLKTKEQGYDQDKNADWLNSVKTDADAHDAEAMLLLGQLYGEGLGVKKDLEKSLELLEQVRILGVANVDRQIVLIKEEIKVLSENEAIEKESRNLESANVQQAKKDKQLKLQAEVKKQDQAEKVKRYEAAMKKLQLEQKKINEQQAWASGGTSLSADDEI